MTPQIQTIFSDPSEGIYGNCLSACVASLCDMPISMTPYFRGMNNPENGVAKFIDQFGLKFHGFMYNPTQEWLRNFEGVNGFAIIGGPSPRYADQAHAVIYRYGKPFFDPHPESNFTKNGKINRVYIITKK